MEIYLAHTQGFCAGVAHAIGILNLVLEKYPHPIYVYHEIVHNTAVVEDFKNKGVIFVEQIQDIPDNARVVFSAHGVSPRVIEEAKSKNLFYIDATCPLVKKVHDEARKLSEKAIDVIVIGHKAHEEVIATLGYVRSDLSHLIQKGSDIDTLQISPEKPVGYLTQTTLSLDDTASLIQKLKTRFIHMISPPSKDICYATQNRQNAIKELAKICDIIIICGSKNSSNTNRLKETAEKFDIKTYMVDHAREFDLGLLKKASKVGISSGASVPRSIVDELIKKIKNAYPDSKIHTSRSPERKIRFPLPKI